MVEVVVDQMTIDFALAGLTRDYHFLSFKVVVTTLIVPSHDEKPVGVSSSVAHASGKSLPLTPVHIKLAATLTALECVFPHRIINWHGQQLAAVWTLDFRGARDGSREAEFVVDEVVEEGH